MSVEGWHMFLLVKEDLLNCFQDKNPLLNLRFGNIYQRLSPRTNLWLPLNQR